MAKQKREIVFNKSMVADKRDANNAFLVQTPAQVGQKGLYPSAGFEVRNSITSTYEIVDILGYNRYGVFPNGKPKVLVKDGNTLKIYEVGKSGTTNADTASAFPLRGTAFGNQGVYFVASNNKVYSPIYNNTNTVEIATFPSNPNTSIGAFDGLYYWWIGSQIWRQLNTGTPQPVMSATGFANACFADFYRDDMFIYDANDLGDSMPTSTKVFVWDKQNTTFFKKRMVFLNERLLAGGTVDGVPILVTQEQHTGNKKEANGMINIRVYNGEQFVLANQVKSSGARLQRPGNHINSSSVSCTQTFMLFAVLDNVTGSGDPTDDLAKNYIFKVFKDGSLQVAASPEDDLATADIYARAVCATYDYDVYGTEIGGTNGTKVLSNENNSISKTDYAGFAARYITNFLNNAYNEHTLLGLSFSFEKLWGTEELDIYYRTSSTESFTLLANITRQKVIDNMNTRVDKTGMTPTPTQRYQVVKMPDGSSLPEFNEIQFKFVSKNGFSIIGAWYEYDYLTREIMT